MKSSLKSSVFDLLSPVLEDEGVELVDIEYEGAGKNRVLRLLIHKPGGVTLGDCQYVNQIADSILKVHRPIQGQYNLEVASPGLDRPLVTEGDFRRNLGRQVQIERSSSTGECLRLSGIVTAVNRGEVFLNSPSGETVHVGISEIIKAHVQLIW